MQRTHTMTKPGREVISGLAKASTEEDETY